MKLQPQIAALYEKLDGELYNFNRGERFLSLNQIMKKYHVHLRVVNGALDRLEKNGLITRERYVGIFSNVCRNKKIPTLLLVVPDYPSPELSGFISIIQTVFEKKPIAKLNLWRYQENERNRIPLNRSDVVLFFGDGFPFSPTELKKLSESGKPIIFTSNEMASSQFSFINFNFFI